MFVIHLQNELLCVAFPRRCRNHASGRGFIYWCLSGSASLFIFFLCGGGGGLRKHRRDRVSIDRLLAAAQTVWGVRAAVKRRRHSSCPPLVVLRRHTRPFPSESRLPIGRSSLMVAAIAKFDRSTLRGGEEGLSTAVHIYFWLEVRGGAAGWRWG